MQAKEYNVKHTFIISTSKLALQAPLPTAGRSPIVSLTVIARKGAPLAVLLTAAYWILFDNGTLNSGAAKTCIGSGHSGRISSGEAAQIKARFRD